MTVEEAINNFKGLVKKPGYARVVKRNPDGSYTWGPWYLEHGLVNENKVFVQDEYGNMLGSASDDAGGEAIVNRLRQEADTASKAKEESIKQANIYGAKTALEKQLDILNQIKSGTTGDIAKYKQTAQSDVDKARAEMFGGNYGYDINNDGTIDAGEMQTVNPLMSQAQKQGNQITQNLNKQFGGGVTSNVGAGLMSQGQKGLNDLLYQMQTTKSKDIADYTEQKTGETREEEKDVATGLAGLIGISGEQWETYMKDDGTMGYRKKQGV